MNKKIVNVKKFSPEVLATGEGGGGNLKKIFPTNNDMDFLTFHIFTTMDLFCLIFFHLDFYLDFFIFNHGYILKNFFLLMDFCSLDPLDIQTLNRGGVRILNGMAQCKKFK